MKIVLDTNVLIAAFISHGTCNELLEYCAVNHEVILSAFILGELKDKLVRKFGFATHEADSVVQLLTSKCAVVTPLAPAEPICRDPDDDKIIGTAFAANCECIVTGDKDLLELRRVKGVRIISPSDFWTMED
jgi:uncharacterized protein